MRKCGKGTESFGILYIHGRILHCCMQMAQWGSMKQKRERRRRRKIRSRFIFSSTVKHRRRRLTAGGEGGDRGQGGKGSDLRGLTCPVIMQDSTQTHTQSKRCAGKNYDEHTSECVRTKLSHAATTVFFLLFLFTWFLGSR